MKLLEAFYNDSPTKNKTRKKIIQMAIKKFSEDDIYTVTMKNIADGCGITIRNLYRYYPGKEYLVMDAAYVFMRGITADELNVQTEGGSGLEQLEDYLKLINVVEHSGSVGLKLVRFIMYFDLYLTNQDQDHPAYKRYVIEYSQELKDTGYLALTSILKRGIRDGSIKIQQDEIDFYKVFLFQALTSVIMRTVVKESENPAINNKLVDKQIEVMVAYMSQGSHKFTN